MKTVIEDEDVAIGEGIGVVLMTEFVPAPFPTKSTALLVDNRHRVQQSKAGEQVTIGQDLTGISCVHSWRRSSGQMASTSGSRC